MKNKFIAVLSVYIVLCSCSTAYRTSQTPDDVYYSPAREVKPYQDQYEDYTSADDRYLRMKVQNYNRWAPIDDYNYWYDSRYYDSYYAYQGYGYGYSPYHGYNSFYYNPYNSWYYPYCTVVYYKNPTVYFGANTNSRSYLAAYRNNNYSNGNTIIPLQNGKRTNAFTLTQNTNNTRPVRTFNGGSSNNAGGRSGGFKSTGSSTPAPRPPRSGGGGN